MIYLSHQNLMYICPHVISSTLVITLLLSCAVNRSAQVPPTPTPTPTAIVHPSFFGMHDCWVSHVDQPWPTALFATLRTWDEWPGVSWGTLNPSRGTYDWTNLDRAVDLAVSHGVDIIYTFGYTPAWAQTSPTVPNLADWQKFVSVITTRYKKRIKYWELWNEPNVSNFWQGTTGQLVSMAAAAYPIIGQMPPPTYHFDCQAMASDTTSLSLSEFTFR